MRATRHPRRTDRERGTLLLPVLVLTLVLGGLSVALLQESLADRTSVQHHETSLLALEIAETGVVRAEMEIHALRDLDGNGIGNAAGDYGEGRFDVQATQDPAYPDRWVVRSRGERDLSTRTIEIGLRRRERGYFLEGLFSRDDMELAGSITTDSYDSAAGTWDEQAIHGDAGGRYAGGSGHVGSNGGIRAVGTKVHIRGNAIPGPLDVTETSGDPTIWGDVMPREREIPIPPPEQAEFLAAFLDNDNDQLLPPGVGEGGGGPGALRGGGGKKKGTGYDPRDLSLRPPAQTDVHLRGGTYFFTDVELGAGSSLVIDGPCRIYVTGELDLTGGGVVNRTGTPADCLVFAHPYALPPGFDPSDGTVRLTGNSEAAFAVYAPYREVVLEGTSDMFGAVVGQKIVVQGDPVFHYDEALRSVVGGSVVYLERLYWREISLPRR